MLFFGPKGCIEIFRHLGCRENFQVVLCLKKQLGNILGCFVAQRATEKLIMLEENFDIHLRPEGCFAPKGCEEFFEVVFWPMVCVEISWVLWPEGVQTNFVVCFGA